MFGKTFVPGNKKNPGIDLEQKQEVEKNNFLFPGTISKINFYLSYFFFFSFFSSSSSSFWLVADLG